jgi:SagB-type dehydrogenase family enzyme
VRRAEPPVLCARVVGHARLEIHANGEIAVRFSDHSLTLGKFTAGAAERAKDLRTGLPFSAFAYGGDADKEIAFLVRRLARHGLLEYRLACARNGEDQVVIEPQLPDYWPRMPPLGNADVLVLSRFAYLRRRGHELILESPRAGALFRIYDPKIAAALARLATPQTLKKLRRQNDFPEVELLALLVDCQILFKTDAAGDDGLRPAEGDGNLVLWDFHDLLFHARSTEGRHANPLGGVYPYAGVISPLPAVRPCWLGEKIELRKSPAAATQQSSPTARLLRERHSTRSFDDQRPITLTELSEFLDGTARVQSEWSSGDGGGVPPIAYTARPYPSGGSSYELELYLAVDKCEGLSRGFYHYDAGAHALVPIAVRPPEFEALLKAAEFAMDATARPQILITIAARFGRISWKYSSIAYALILKDVGVLTQTFYMMATDMGLGGCAIGSTNIDLFAKMTGIGFYVESAVGQFAIGRSMKPEAAG